MQSPNRFAVRWNRILEAPEPAVFLHKERCVELARSDLALDRTSTNLERHVTLHSSAVVHGDGGDAPRKLSSGCDL